MFQKQNYVVRLSDLFVAQTFPLGSKPGSVSTNFQAKVIPGHVSTFPSLENNWNIPS